MKSSDKRIIIDWLGETSSKGIMEDTEIEATRPEIDAFVQQIHTHLHEHYDSRGWVTVYESPASFTYRMEVPGGWIYRTVARISAFPPTSVFVPEPK